jgi:hypothetical protein
LQATDVLIGRGSGPNDHEGNILFRSLVRDRKSEYMATNHRQTKTKIAREVIDTVLAQNGRFMKKIDPAEAKKLGIPKGVDAWCPVNKMTVMEKAKQALRQKAEKGGGGLPDRPSPEASPASASPIPPETLSHYAHETSDEAHWNTGHPDHTQMYAPNQGYLSHALPGGAYLSKDDSPYQQMIAAHGMAELDHEHLTQMNVHRNAVLYEGEKEVGDGIHDDARRRSLRVEDLMHSIHQVGTDEFGSSHAKSSNLNYSHESNETMGTIEPLAMDASSFSMMSMSSIFKGPLCDTPRSSFTGRPGLTRLDSGRFLCDSENIGRSHGSHGRRFSYERDDSNRSIRTEYSGASDMSMSLSHLDALLGDGGPHHVSLEPEGKEGKEDASNSSLAFDPRLVELMAEHPDSQTRLFEEFLILV